LRDKNGFRGKKAIRAIARKGKKSRKNKGLLNKNTPGREKLRKNAWRKLESVECKRKRGKTLIRFWTGDKID